MFVTVKEAAIIAQKSEGTIRNWIRTGRIEANKQGRFWQIVKKSLVGYLSKSSKVVADAQESVSQIVLTIVSEIKNALLGITDKSEIENLKESNISMALEISNLKREIEALKSKEQQQTDALPQQQEILENKGAYAIQNTSKAEQWLRDNYLVWVDTRHFCPSPRKVPQAKLTTSE